MTLTGNRPLSELHRLKWKTNEAESKSKPNGDDQEEKGPFVVNLGPLEIKTFLVQFQSSKIN